MQGSIRFGVVLSAFCAVLAASGVELPHVFGDNMVLQRGQRVPVWGKGAPGEKVTVSFAGQSVSAIVGADGRWTLEEGDFNLKIGRLQQRIVCTKTIIPSGDLEGDMRDIKLYFKDFCGKNPENFATGLDDNDK